MSSEHCGEYTEYSSCSCCGHPDDEEELVDIVNDFMQDGNAEKYAPVTSPEEAEAAAARLAALQAHLKEIDALKQEAAASKAPQAQKMDRLHTALKATELRCFTAEQRVIQLEGEIKQLRRNISVDQGTGKGGRGTATPGMVPGPGTAFALKHGIGKAQSPAAKPPAPAAPVTSPMAAIPAFKTAAGATAPPAAPAPSASPASPALAIPAFKAK